MSNELRFVVSLAELLFINLFIYQLYFLKMSIELGYSKTKLVAVIIAPIAHI